jgi:hypothetical protein
MYKLLALFVFTSLISSCATQEQKAQARQNQIEYYKAQCYNYGFREGTAEYANCIMQLDSQEQQRQQALIRQLMINNQNQQIVVPRPPVRTNCYSNGAYTNCTSQ